MCEFINYQIEELLNYKLEEPLKVAGQSLCEV